MIKNHLDLSTTDCHVPRLLIVFEMPADRQDWLLQDETGLLLKRCAYWCNLRGQNETTNTTTCRVHISRSNKVTPETLRQIMLRIAQNQEIGNVL